MKLVRCKDQSGTLEENFGAGSFNETMLQLVERLRQTPNEYHVWGLMSHQRLCLLAEDDYRTPRYVTVAVLDQRNYFIEYRMQADSAPWSEAYVKGEAGSEDEAVQMILVAMRNSGGWSA